MNNENQSQDVSLIDQILESISDESLLKTTAPTIDYDPHPDHHITL